MWTPQKLSKWVSHEKSHEIQKNWSYVHSQSSRAARRPDPINFETSRKHTNHNSSQPYESGRETPVMLRYVLQNITEDSELTESQLGHFGLEQGCVGWYCLCTRWYCSGPLARSSLSFSPARSKQSVQSPVCPLPYFHRIHLAWLHNLHVCLTEWHVFLSPSLIILNLSPLEAKCWHLCSSHGSKHGRNTGEHQKEREHIKDHKGLCATLTLN
jgi:hypothetical protein